LISEGTFSVDPDAINMHPVIDRGELITAPATANGTTPGNGATPGTGYLRFRDTESGISPRALPGLEGYVYVTASDEHDEDGILLSDEFTNPIKRRKMVEKRARKFEHVAKEVPLPQLEGPEDAAVTLVGWGSTYGVIKEAVELLKHAGVTANQLGIKWLVPFHAQEVAAILNSAKHTIIVENSYSGQFARYLRSETGIAANGWIRKYDGEPFLPHHIVEAVLEQLAGVTNHSVPVQEFIV
jgi:2-oxoglutarate/2-oxoacid ferredoxin oxidoreductase subunit alpha